jgi:hypothetical protein
MNKGSGNVLAVNSNGKKIKKLYKRKSKDKDKGNAQVVTSNAFKLKDIFRH